MKKSKKLIPAAVAGVIVTSLATVSAYAAEETPSIPADPSLDSGAVQAENLEQNQNDTRESTALEPSDLQPQVNDDNEVTPPPVNQATEGNETHITGEIEVKNPEEISEEQREEDEEKIKQELNDAFNSSGNLDSENSDSENSGSENSDFENSDFENSDFENSDFENSDFENSDFENSDFENSDFENSDSENSDSEKTDSEKTDSENSDSENSDSENSDSENSDSENSDSENSGTLPSESADFDMEDWDLSKVGEVGSQFGNFTVISNEKVTDEADENTSTQEVKLGMTLDRGDMAASPLTQTELETLVGQALTQNADGSYFYTSDGVTYTYTVTNNSTQHTECDVIVAITRTIKAGNNDEVNTKTDDEWSSENQDSASSGEETEETDSTPTAADILNGVDRMNGKFGDKTAKIEYNEDGEIEKIIVYETDNKNGASTTYTFEYDGAAEVETLDPTDFNDQQTILDLLGKDFKIEDGKFYKTVNGVDYLMTDAEIQIALKSQSVTMTVSIRSEGESTPSKDSDESLEAAQERVTKEATANALGEALKKAANISGEAKYDEDGYFVTVNDIVYKFTKNEDGTYSVTVPGKDGENEVQKTYTFSITGTDATPTKGNLAEDIKAELEDNQELANGSTTSIKADVTVKGDIVSWTRTEEGGSIISDQGTVVAEIGKRFGDEGETVTQITYVKDTDGNDTNQIATVVTTNGNVTKTYTFSYGKAELTDLNLTEDEKTKYDITDLTKTSWTVEVKTAQQATDVDDTTKNQGSITKNADGTLTYVDQDGHKVTLTYDENEYAYVAHVDVEGNGNLWTYKITEGRPVDLVTSDQLLRDELAKSGYENVTILEINNNNHTATFTCNGKTYTVEFEEPQQYSYNIIIEAPKTICSAESEDALIQKIKDMIEELKDTGKTLISSDPKGNPDNGSPSEDDIKKYWITPDTAINFDAMTQEELKILLTELKAQTDALRGTEDDPKPIEKDGVDHLDLGCDTGIAVDGERQDCVIVSTPTLIYSYDVEQIVNQLGTQETLQEVIRVDKVNTDDDGNPIIHYEFENNDKENYPKDYAFYYVSGQVGYDLIKFGDQTWTTDYEKAEAALQKLRDEGNTVAGIVTIYEPISGTDGTVVNGYRVYQKVAKLEVYGYMDSRSNACGNWGTGGFDLKLGNLTLMEEGIAKGTGAGIENWTANCIIQSKDSGTVDVLRLKNIITDGEGGAEVTGSYTVNEKLYDSEDGSKILSATGTANGSYSEYSLWETSDGTGSEAGRTWYEGGASYDLQRTELDIDEQEWLVRNLDAEYTVSQYTPPADPPRDEVREEVRDEDDVQNPNVPSSESPEEATISDEDVPLADIPDEDVPLADVSDEDVPLADISDEDVPLADISDEDVPLADISDEDVPLADISDEDVPLADIPDEGVPLADVPQTGDISGFWRIFTLLSASGLAALTAKKRKDEKT